MAVMECDRKIREPGRFSPREADARVESVALCAVGDVQAEQAAASQGASKLSKLAHSKEPFPMADSSGQIKPLYPILYEAVVRRALEEDLGRAGDLTTDAIVPPDASAQAALVARRGGRIAGMDLAACAFRLLDPGVTVAVQVQDGCDAAPGERLAEIAANVLRLTQPAKPELVL